MVCSLLLNANGQGILLLYLRHGVSHTQELRSRLFIKKITCNVFYNNDRTVNGLDWGDYLPRSFRCSRNGTGVAGVWFTPLQPSDINNDGVVNSIDFSLLNANWGRTIQGCNGVNHALTADEVKRLYKYGKMTIM